MAKSAAERTKECRARKKAGQTISQRWGDLNKHARVMQGRRKEEKQLAVASKTKTVSASKQAIYRKNLSELKTSANLEKAKVNSKKWRQRHVFCFRLRAQVAERVRRYRQTLSIEERAEQLKKSILRSQLQRVKYRKYRSITEYMCRRYGYYKRDKSEKNRLERNRRYFATRIDTTVLERSRKRRRCIHPPCKEITLTDGVCHFGKYCPYLYPGARKLQMEENNRKGLSTAIYDPDPRYVYFDNWNRAYVRRLPSKDFVSPLYVHERTGVRYFAGINRHDGRLILYDYDHPDSDSSDDSYSDDESV